MALSSSRTCLVFSPFLPLRSSGCFVRRLSSSLPFASLALSHARAIQALMFLHAQLHFRQLQSWAVSPPFLKTLRVSKCRDGSGCRGFGVIGFGRVGPRASRVVNQGQHSVTGAAAAHRQGSPLLICTPTWQLCFACRARWRGQRSCTIEHFIYLH